jgi:hypothetical protein
MQNAGDCHVVDLRMRERAGHDGEDIAKLAFVILL